MGMCKKEKLSPRQLLDFELNILVHVFFADDFATIVRNNFFDSIELITFQNKLKRFPGR